MVFSGFFLKIIAFSEIITQNAISTLQYDRLNRGYCMLLSVFPIFAPLQPEKITLQLFSLLGTYASTLYIGKRLKAYYLPFAAVLLFDI